MIRRHFLPLGHCLKMSCSTGNNVPVIDCLPADYNK